MTNLVLLSGGVESAVLVHEAARQGATEALFVDYGQRGAAPERQAAEAASAAARVRLTAMDMEAVGAAFRARQVHKLHVPLPHRNIVILGLALAFAEQIGAVRVLIGLNHSDARDHPGADAALIARFNTLAEAAGAARIEAPLIALSKPEIIQRGIALGIDFATTYSCLVGEPRHCGVCPQCRRRREAFIAADVAEPPTFYRRAP